jgi:hypothetical protein
MNQAPTISYQRLPAIPIRPFCLISVARPVSAVFTPCSFPLFIRVYSRDSRAQLSVNRFPCLT